MGNVNGREDDGGGGNGPSGVEEEEEAGGIAQQSMAGQGGRYGNHGGDGGELLGQSPPPSPRASQSPLMFRPQASCLLLFKFYSFYTKLKSLRFLIYFFIVLGQN